jgi:hypothetical protein
MISRQESGEEQATRLGESEKTPISIRELLIRDKSIVRLRLDVNTSRLVYDTDKKPIEIAKDFFEEVLLKDLI